jgi:hypothetical protein
VTALTLHFGLEEFLQSEAAERMGRKVVASPAVEANLRRLCESLLEPIRVKLQRPMVITSGFRPDWLNTFIGGSRNSAHLEGRAADIRVVGMSPLTFSRWVQNNAVAEGWPIDQCIYEGSWTHLAIAEQPRGQYLTAVFGNGGVTYKEGLA